MPRKRSRFERWQTLLGAAIGAVAAVLAAVLTVTLTSGSSGSPAPTGHGAGVTLSFVSWSQSPAQPPPGESYTFVGTVQGLPKLWDVEVVVQVSATGGAAPEASGATWLVSPPATISADGRWSVSWLIQQPLSSAHWIAVADDNGCATANPLSCVSGGGSSTEPDLQQYGPQSSYVKVTVPAPKK
jgi:hypothetical protein